MSSTLTGLRPLVWAGNRAADSKAMQIGANRLLMEFECIKSTVGQWGRSRTCPTWPRELERQARRHLNDARVGCRRDLAEGAAGDAGGRVGELRMIQNVEEVAND